MLDLIVGDGDRSAPYLLLWRLKDGQFEGPKGLAWHRDSFRIQRVHVPPCFNAESSQIVCTADSQGYEQGFVVDVSDLVPARPQ